jgi:Bacterial Ig-like domain (group 3)/Abnormal spindle-like microcephaly-assoc'd, ASPM-SPD-2-Hydin/Beta-propeller repeat
MSICRWLGLAAIALGAAQICFPQGQTSISDPALSPVPASRGSSLPPAPADGKLLPSKLNQEAVKIPLEFETNQGQAPSRYSFVAHGPAYALGLSASEMALTLHRPVDRNSSKQDPNSLKAIPSANLDLRLLGANGASAALGLDPQPGRSNYFIGNDPSKWQTNVPQFGRVKFAQVYPGIDLIFHGNDQQLEYDFNVAAGADPDRIRVATEGTQSVTIGADGAAILHTKLGDVELKRPVAYQEHAGVRQPVESGFRLVNGSLAFRVGAYDHSRALTIDPVLDYAVSLGGSNGNWSWSVELDAAGNTYVSGTTCSADFPTTAGPFQQPPSATSLIAPNNCYAGFVTKMDPTGSTLLYSDFFGGTNGSSGASNLEVDNSGNVYLTGATSATDFPTVSNIGPSGPTDCPLAKSGHLCLVGFVLKLNSAGSQLLFSSLLGGNQTTGGYQVQLNPVSGDLDIVGDTDSSNFLPAPTTLETSYAGGICANSTPCFSGFLLGLDPTTGALRYGTYIGGAQNDWVSGLAFDSNGNIYVSGSTQPPLSSALGTVTQTYAPSGGATAAGAEMFIAKFNLSGTALTPGYLTIIQGDADSGTGQIALDSSNNLYFTGGTASQHLPVTSGAYQTTNKAQGGSDCFFGMVITPFLPSACGTAVVGKLNTAGALSFLTYLGGSTQDVGEAIGVDSNNNIWIAGLTSSTDFPFAATPYAFPGGFFSPFLAEMSNNGQQLLDSTLIAGPNGEVSYIEIDSNNNIYVTGYSLGQVPSTPGTYPPNPNVFIPVFVEKWSAGTPPSISISSSSAGFGPTPLGSASPPQTITVQNTGSVAAQLGIQLTSGFSETSPSDFLESSNCGTSLAGNSSCTITVIFAPGPLPATCGPPSCYPSDRTAELLISNNAIQGQQAIQLSGSTGIGPSISVTPNPIVFPEQAAGTSSAALYVQVENAGDSDLLTSSIALTGTNASDFQLALTGTGGRDCVGTSLGPGTLCDLDITFSPAITASGTRTASLVFTDSAADTPQTVPVTGSVAGAYALNLSPLTLAPTFPVAFGTSTFAPLTIQNPSANSVQITSLTVTGANQADFIPAPNSCLVNGNQTLPITVAAGAICYVEVTFNPQPGASGLRTATLTVGTSPAISGLPTIALSGEAVTNSQPAMGFIQVPDPLNFGGLQVGETSNNQSVLFAIENNAPIPCAGGSSSCGAPLVINSITPGLSDYTVTAEQSAGCAPYPVTIPIGGSCTYSVVFTPAMAGLRNTALTIQSNDPQGPVQLPVYGSGLSVPLGEFLQTALNFGNSAIGVASPPMTATIENTGQSPLNISAVAASANFNVSANTCTGTIQPQTTCTISVTFTPPTATFFNGTLTITDNDPLGTQQVVNLTGTGATGPQLRITPQTLNFGNQTLDTASPAQTITFTSTGDSTVTFPANPVSTTQDFIVQSTTCAGSLPVGASCTANVQFKPTIQALADFFESGVMRVTDNASGSPQPIYMQGSGETGTMTSTAALLSSLNPSSGGQLVTFMVMVAGSHGNTTVPSGAVSLLDGTTFIGSAAINGFGVARFGTAALSVGSHSITAVYGGDTNFATSTSNQITQVVTSAAVPDISWTPATTILHGDPGNTDVLNASASTSGTFTYAATPTGGGSPIDITAGTSTLAAGTYDVMASFTPSNTSLYSSTQSTASLLVSGVSVWIVDGSGGLSELAGNGYSITSAADSGANLAVAIDGSGNAWTVGSGSPLLEETSQTGASLLTIPSGTGGLSSPTAIVIDGNGQVWVANNNSVSLFSNAGAALSPATGFTDSSFLAPGGIAVDMTGSVWITNQGNNSVTRILGAAAPAAPLATSAANKTTGEKP